MHSLLDKQTPIRFSTDGFFDFMETLPLPTQLQLMGYVCVLNGEIAFTPRAQAWVNRNSAFVATTTTEYERSRQIIGVQNREANPLRAKLATRLANALAALKV